jgi:hypothetical protein
MKAIQRRIVGDLLAVPSSGYSQVIQRRTGGALLQAAPSSGYGHSSYNDGYQADHSDHYGSFSGHGSGCCPLVVDPLSYAALIGGIALATYFFQIQITNSMLARSFPWPFNTGWVFQGTHLYFTIRKTKTHKNLLIKAKPPNKVANKSESITRGQHKPQRSIKKP